jgi:hypothetical protein
MTDRGFFRTDPPGLMPVEAHAGQTTDILLEVTNPGWMAHGHTPEHAESGMTFSFDEGQRPEAIR